MRIRIRRVEAIAFSKVISPYFNLVLDIAFIIMYTIRLHIDVQIFALFQSSLEEEE